jgi:hypothetical protein
MKKKSGYFVKINYDNCGRDGNSINNSSFAKSNEMNLKKYLLCAGIFNKKGNTIIFQANDMSEAEDIINNNPFRESRIYSYEILKNDRIAL